MEFKVPFQFIFLCNLFLLPKLSQPTLEMEVKKFQVSIHSFFRRHLKCHCVSFCSNSPSTLETLNLFSAATRIIFARIEGDVCVLAWKWESSNRQVFKFQSTFPTQNFPVRSEHKNLKVWFISHSDLFTPLFELFSSSSWNCFFFTSPLKTFQSGVWKRFQSLIYFRTREEDFETGSSSPPTYFPQNFRAGVKMKSRKFQLDSLSPPKLFSSSWSWKFVVENLYY